MKQEIQIQVPNDWSAVTLKKYLALQKDLKVYGDNEAGYIACLMHHLCGFDVTYLSQLDTETFNKIKSDILSFYGKSNYEHQTKIVVDGKKYGFEPNLSRIAYGAYLDIAKYDTFTIDENWANIMSILYRPIKKESMGLYEIEDYTGELYPEKFEEITMDVHFGALFFFLHLLMDLQNSTLKSLMEQVAIPQSIKSVLEQSGKITHQLFNLPTVTSEQ
jgi:hypothetical protein